MVLISVSLILALFAIYRFVKFIKRLDKEEEIRETSEAYRKAQAAYQEIYNSELKKISEARQYE